MELQYPVAEMRSLAPIQTLCPVYSVQQKSWCKVYRAECMVPFPTYSIKIVYIITFIAFKIFVRIELYLVPMVYPQAFPIESNAVDVWSVGGAARAIPIASYSFNCLYCARCGLGLSCGVHVPGFAAHPPKEEEKLPQQSEPKIQKQ